MNPTAPDIIFNAIARGGSAWDLRELMTQPNFDSDETNTAGLTCLKAAIINGDGTHVEAVLDAGCNISEDVLKFAERCYPHKIQISHILKSTLACRAAQAACSELAP